MAILRCVHGGLEVVGYEPDGDSLRFGPDDPDAFAGLRYADRIRRNQAGTVQLRLEAIDAPESHYAGRAQPLATEAAQRLLDLAGFTGVRRQGTVVAAAEPARVGAAVLTQAADTNGRPIALLLVGDDLPAAGDVEVDAAVFDQTLNAQLLREGAAYLTLYTSLADDLAAAARAAAREARNARRGVWAVDATPRFDLDALGPDGQLILPKLLRRATDFLARPEGAPDLRAWLEADPDHRDDLLVRADGSEVRLSDLVEQAGDVVTTSLDPLVLTVVER